MERRRALVVAGAVTISALAGATAVGATTGLLGFGGPGADPAPAAAADHPAIETKIVHLPGHQAAKPAAGAHAPTGASATPPSASPPSTGHVTVAGTETEPTTVVPATPTTEPPEPPEAEEPSVHEVEPPESPEPPEPTEPAEHETGD